MKSSGIYIHIPFCKRKCNYCDFLSGPADAEVRKRYLDQLLRELTMVVRLMKKQKQRIRTIYLGGGTPSVLETGQLQDILGILTGSGLVMEDCEITMEVNPGTVDEEKLRAVHKAGVNRLSMGVQSFQPEELSLLGRIHTAGEAEDCFHMARNAGFDNISLDLMSGLPGQTRASFEDTLYKALSLKPEHISAYSLIIEPGTPFYETYGPHFSEDAEDLDRALYDLTEERLKEAGYYRYEISNYAKTGYESRHNCSYWTGYPYYGCGLGASSLLSVGPMKEDGNLSAEQKMANPCWYRCVNPGQMETYLLIPFDRIEDPDSLFNLYYEETEGLSEKARMEEFMFLGLRMTSGVSAEEFARRFKRSVESVFGAAFRKLQEEELLEFADGKIRLTHKGLDLSNYCFTYFLLEEEEAF